MEPGILPGKTQNRLQCDKRSHAASTGAQGLEHRSKDHRPRIAASGHARRQGMHVYYGLRRVPIPCAGLGELEKVAENPFSDRRKTALRSKCPG
jgi:hypothetical protein